MMTLGDAAGVVGGTVSRAVASATFDRVNTDSRAVQPADLFVALKGERFDGHEFVAQALGAGAAGALIASDARARFAPNEACVAVRDTRLALGQLARSWRERFSLPLIAVVGSNGKTTVTQMIASILREHAGAAAFHTQGNYNNDIGLPLTLLRLRDEHRIGVVELGMNHRGEIAYLAGIARPTIALINNAQREHQEFMTGVADVAMENGSIFDSLPFDGVAIVNADDAFANHWIDRAGGRKVVTFGITNPADVRGVLDAGDGAGSAAFGTHLRLEVAGGVADVVLRIPGRHNAMNAVAAAAAATAAGIAIDAIARGLNAFAPVAGRLVKSVLDNGTVVLDDSYNANPDSVRAAIDVLAGIGGRRVLVLGGMGEVGKEGPAFHREVGSYAAMRQIDALLTLGTEAAAAAVAFGPAAQPCADIDALIERARDAARPGTTILVKGSRSARMERVVRALAGLDADGGESH
ncbi:MAG: UDP-N-acetylmuramoyl-tripeptide--D-alanyl-D-alanine ligase [Betaproteobacteria bacterium]